MCRQQAVINQDVDMATLQAKSKKVDTSRLFDGLLPMLVRHIYREYMYTNHFRTTHTTKARLASV